MLLRFVDANDLRVAELRRVVPALALAPASLPVGYATAAPDPAARARDMVLASGGDDGCLAEAADLTTMDGKSLRLELDSDTANRFCRFWRQTPVQFHLCVALRRGPEAPVELFTAVGPGQIAERPAGPPALGWDRLFIADGFELTLAQLTEASLRPGSAFQPDPVGLRRTAYGAVAAALGLA